MKSQSSEGTGSQTRVLLFFMKWKGKRSKNHISELFSSSVGSSSDSDDENIKPATPSSKMEKRPTSLRPFSTVGRESHASPADVTFIRNCLRRSILFQETDFNILDQFVQTAKKKEKAGGSVLLERGAPAGKTLVLVKGELAVFKNDEVKKTERKVPMCCLCF